MKVGDPFYKYFGINRNKFKTFPRQLLIEKGREKGREKERFLKRENNSWKYSQNIGGEGKILIFLCNFFTFSLHE